MAEDPGNKEEEEFEFDSASQAITSISLNQARVLAFRHARDNRDFYHPPSNRWPQRTQDKETTT